MNGYKELLEKSVPENRLALCWLGQGGFAVKNHAGKVLLLDPYLSDYVEKISGPAFARLVPPPLPVLQCRADYLVLTHEHEDHTDDEAVPGLVSANPEMKIFAPGAARDKALRLTGQKAAVSLFQRGDHAEAGGFSLNAVRADHTEDSIGLMLKSGGVTLYFTGDGEYSEEVFGEAAAFRPQYVVAVINGKWGNMDAAQAVDMMRFFPEAVCIPCHYGMFTGNTVDPKRFFTLAEQAGVPTLALCHNASKEV